MYLFHENMNNVLLLWIFLVSIIFEFLPNAFGRFILEEVDQKEDNRVELEAGTIDGNKNTILAKYIINDIMFFHYPEFLFLSNLFCMKLKLT